MGNKLMDIDVIDAAIGLGLGLVIAVGGTVIREKSRERGEISKVNLTIDKIKNSYSKLCDEMILAEISKNEKKLRYVSGYFNLTLQDSFDEVKVDVELYFQDDKENWIKKSSSENLRLEIFTEEARKDLVETKHIKFEVDPPESLNND